MTDATAAVSPLRHVSGGGRRDATEGTRPARRTAPAAGVPVAQATGWQGPEGSGGADAIAKACGPPGRGQTGAPPTREHREAHKRVQSVTKVTGLDPGRLFTREPGVVGVGVGNYGIR